MKLLSTSRRRRLVFVAVMLFVLGFPLVSSLATRARLERSGIDVTASVVETSRRDDGYLVAFRLPEEADPDQKTYSAEVGRAAYEKAVETEQITVRVLEDRPEAHLVEGEIRSNTPYVIGGASIALVLVVGLWWVRVGRRRPTIRLRALGPLEPASAEDAGMLGRIPDEDLYEAVGTLLSADDAEAVLDVGERLVVVVLDGHPHPVEIGSPARVRGPVIG